MVASRAHNDLVSGTLVFAERNNPKHAIEKPYNMRFDPGEGLPRSNLQYEARDVLISDLRSRRFRFDEDAIQLVEHQSAMRYEDFENEGTIKDIFLAEVADMLESLLAVDKVYVFEYVIRRRHPEFPAPTVNLEEQGQPVVTAHIDYTEADLIDRIHGMFDDRAEEYLKRPFVAVNVWRPLAGPVQDWPLAYCDPSTVDIEKDLLEVDEASRVNAFELYNLHHNPKQNWYYVKDQQPWEMVIFSEHDSRHPKTRSVPHCSFALDGGTASARRESIEVRALAFF